MVDLLTLEDIQVQQHRLSAYFHVDNHRFCTSYWFDTVDFPDLEARWGREFMRRIYFHIAAFEINKICSLRPSRIEWGSYEQYVDEPFWNLWSTVFRNVWAQWRYENDDPEYFGPKFGGNFTQSNSGPVDRDLIREKTLAFFGGGKDSLVAAKLLESIEQPYDSLVYASSIYGNLGSQHQQISRLLNFCNPDNRHRQWILDDFLDAPVVTLGPKSQSKTLTAAETPSSIFASLPIALAHDITDISLGHEKSSDTGQVIWEKTGEDVNHQWGKSFEAERLLNQYIRDHLMCDFRYFSILKPIHDVLIFNLLREHEELAVHTQSCNLSKPWCRRCPKCVYVWVNYMAYLDIDLVNSIFKENLGDVSENVPIFRGLLGFADQIPFECVGQADETRLAFEICLAKGVTGLAFDMYKQEQKPLDLTTTLNKYLASYSEESAIPSRFQPSLDEKFHSAARTARQYMTKVLGG